MPSLPLAKRQRKNDKFTCPPVVTVIRVPHSLQLVRGLQDLHQNGGLQLFIDALTIYRQNEQRVQRDSKNRLEIGDS